VVTSIRRISESLYGKLHYSQVSFIRINPRDDDVPVGAISIKAGGLKGIKSLVKEC